MDLMIEIVKLEQEELQQYVTALEKSDIPKIIRWDIIELLKTAHRQTLQAENMGWL